ncbi:endonuclease 8-like 1 [Amia ocellicauda]|uniref:endonuclease 8-like 1 n=1 Tax=Amia ocellicauda TaxID=2972642 RepID=UPI003463F7CE|nr:NEIL1 Endonuclease [Amia calva]
MPEGPELHMASRYVNRVCAGVVFSGAVEKSEVSKNPEVPFASEAYRISATSRGKEMRLTLTPIEGEDSKDGGETGDPQPMDVVFRFGMSGFFRFTPEDELPKHAHLRFYTRERPRQALSFVDIRRFGTWEPNGNWQPERGPCIMFEYHSFRENVLLNLLDRAFDRPICEALLNQKYFNGIGNYLRAEILYRLKIPPFVKARTVLDGLLLKDHAEKNAKRAKEESTPVQVSEMSLSKKVKVKRETPDLLSLCHTVPLEVLQLGGKGYDPEQSGDSSFQEWLQCYCVSGMKSLRDHNRRTMWFQGDAGPMAPKNSKSPKAKKRVTKQGGDESDDKQVVQEKFQDNKVKGDKEETEGKTGLKRGKGAERNLEATSPVNKGKTIQKRKTATAEQAERRSGRMTRARAKQGS